MMQKAKYQTYAMEGNDLESLVDAIEKQVLSDGTRKETLELYQAVCDRLGGKYWIRKRTCGGKHIDAVCHMRNCRNAEYHCTIQEKV